MIYTVYSIKDTKTGYLQPMFDLNDASAQRNFEHATRDTNSLMYTHGSDFELFRIGEFDSESGNLVPLEHTFICGGRDS